MEDCLLGRFRVAQNVIGSQIDCSSHTHYIL